MKKQLVKKFVSLERDVSVEKGGFLLFALFLRAEAGNVWDLVIAAPWVESDRMEPLRYFANHLTSRLETGEMRVLSRIALVSNKDPRLEDIYEDVEVEHNIVEVVHRAYFDMEIDHAYIITCKREAALSAKGPA